MFKLVISDDEGKTTSVPLVRDDITIGRKEGNTIRLTDRNVSRRHARLQKQNGHYLLHDLGSYNGIVINGVRLNEARPLKHGDQVLIGDYKLAILEESTSQIAVPPPPSNAIEPSETLPDLPVPARPAPTAPGIPSAMPTSHNMNGASAPPAAAVPVPPPPAPPVARISAPPAPPPVASHPQVETPAELGQLRLVFLSPNGVPAPVILDRLPMVLGRSEAADIALPFPSISREHARIFVENGQLVIEDMGSQNGISVNGTKAGRAILTPGDLITLGVVECRVARRGDSTVVIHREPEKKRSPAPVIVGVLGGGVALGLLAFFALRSGTTPTSATAAPTNPVGTQGVAQPLAAPPVTPVAPQPAAMPVAQQPGTMPANTAGAAPAQNTLVAAPTPPQAVDPQGGNAGSPVDPSELDPPSNTPPGAGGTARGRNEPRTARTVRERTGRNETSSASAQSPSSGSSNGPSVTAAPQPRVTAPQPSSPSTSTSAAPGGEQQSALQQARRAISNGDNAGAVEALRGHAQTEPELGLLAITYRTMGNRSDAIRTMQMYLRRFPSGPRSESFRSFIEANPP